MSRRGNIDKLYELASGQWGLFTSAQAVNIGVSRNQLARMANDGRIEPVAYGTYRVTTGVETAHAATKAAWLSLYPKKTAFERLSSQPYDAIASGRTASCLQGFGDFYESPYCFVVAEGKRSTRKELELLHEPVDEQDIDLTYGIPSTTPERTLADLLRLEEEPSLIDDYLEQAASSGHIFDEKRLAVLLGPLCRSYGYENGTAFAENLLGKSAIPAALNSSIDQFVRVLESSSVLQDAVRLSHMVNKSVPAGYEKAVASAAKAVKSSGVHPDVLSSVNALSELMNTVSSFINQNALQNTVASIIAGINAAENAAPVQKNPSDKQPGGTEG
ncbi:type IV toxin-antitoxin system AbiEi family antitoxin domain-containing protein [Collinsella sp. An2]|uniref:type IV toxin-antitoxin system AbiEi family antitoxin domain-containing protein n=1 Tax=Collinsella sp. An2 TaxID=1965585 RepID=UPI000B39C75E|nr:type IV toxin-antitoxin system AbiEi family antitoxin domain-containing protein [Collinsella sp. An2]OUP10054.1 hypothetical protein B5F33_03075 [Collinsella sp. An2]